MATVDAFREDGEEPGRAPTAAPNSRPAQDFRAAGASGVLYFTVRSDRGCRLRAVELPGLSDAAAFDLQSCRFDVSPEGNVAAGPACPEGVVEVRAVDAVSSLFDGCAPAWKPNGDLAFIREGDAVVDTTIFLDDVADSAQPLFPERSSITVREMAWLTDTRRVAIVRGTGVLSGALVVFGEGRRLVGSDPRGSTLHVSRDTDQILAETPGGFLVFDRRGRFRSTRSFPFFDAAAAVESPDGRFIALARPGNVCVYEAGPGQSFIGCVRGDAVDLAWL